MANNKKYSPITPNAYKITLNAGQVFDFVSAATIFPYKVGSTNALHPGRDTYSQVVFFNNVSVFKNNYVIYNRFGTITIT